MRKRNVSAIKRRRRSMRHGAISVLVVTVIVTASLILATAAARADGSPPPIVFPPAGETSPPAETISDPNPWAWPSPLLSGACSGWYQESSYAGFWPTASTWWEYSCTYAWPVLGTGATSEDWGGEYVWTDYFYWDGSEPVFYGDWFYDGYWDSMISATYCTYWQDKAATQWYQAVFCY
jgi:hypothetical protein